MGNSPWRTRGTLAYKRLNRSYDGSVCVVYENTKTYGALEIAHGIKDTDRNGGAVIHVYGSSRVCVAVR
jgi:hypothetical protein